MTNMKTALAALALAAIPATAKATLPTVADLVDIQLVDSTFHGTPFDLLEVQSTVIFSTSAPPGVWIKNLQLVPVAHVSSIDLGLGDLDNNLMDLELLKATFLTQFDADVVFSFVTEPSPAGNPPFDVTFNPIVSLPLASFGFGDSFSLGFDIFSSVALTDGAVGWKWAGSVIPTPGTVALLTASGLGASLHRRRGLGPSEEGQ